MAFLVEETLGNFDFRILRLSISLGTKFQRNRLVLIRAQAGLRKGVVASAISSMQTVWWGRSRLAYPGVTLFFGQRRTSVLKASHKKWKTKRQAVQEDYTCACFAFGGPTSPRIGFQWVFRQAPQHRSWPRLISTRRDPDGVDRLATAPGLVKAGVLENHTSRDLSGHDSFCVASKQTKNKVLVKNWKDPEKEAKRFLEANLPSSISACSGRDRRSCIVRVLSFESNYEQRPVVRRFPPDFAQALFAASHTEVACCTWCQGFFDHLLPGLSAPRETSYFYTDFQIDAVCLWAVSILIGFLKKREQFLISRKLRFTESTWTFGGFRARGCWNTNAFQAFRMPCQPMPSTFGSFSRTGLKFSVSDQSSRSARWRAQAQ